MRQCLFEICIAQCILELSDRDFYLLTRPYRITPTNPLQIDPVTNIDALCKANDNFRQVVQTGKYTQLVLMSLNPGENIGLETHSDTDQTFKIVKGHGTCIIDGKVYFISKGYSIFVKAGQQHDIINGNSGKKMKLTTTYSPPEHPPGTIHRIKPL